MALSPSVSVMISVYGNYARVAGLRAVLQQWRLQTVRPEIVLSEQSEEEPTFKALAAELGIRYVHSRPDVTPKGVQYNIGRVRNAALSTTTGTYLYVTDADVFPLRSDYLERLMVRCNPDEVWQRPKIFRLAEHAVGAFLDEATGRPDAVPVPHADFCLSDFSRGLLVPASGGEVQETYEGWTYVCTSTEHAMLNTEDFDEEGETNLIMRPDTHWGGTFLMREAALRVGGYAEVYYGWGLEDEDFHTKLGYLCKARPILKRELVHFEHPRPYNGTVFWENERLYESRLQNGIPAMIDHDLNNPHSLIQTLPASPTFPT